jgi:hypothetical protein
VERSRSGRTSRQADHPSAVCLGSTSDQPRR